MTGYDARCPYCRERATLSVQYGGDVGPCPQHAVHWVGEPGQGPTSLHGNGAASFTFTSGDEDDVTCTLCLTLLARESSVQEPEHPKPNSLAHLTPMTDDDLLRLADRPGGINDQLRAAQDHTNGSTR